jgi:nucleotide-binding universal stress UspA family protein
LYKKFLLAYDGSHDGRAALMEGAELAEACKAEVVLLAVVEVGSDVGAAEAYASGEPSDREARQIREVLDEGLLRLGERGLAATATVAFGSPAEHIAAKAQEISADLVVIGHRQHGLWSLWMHEPVGAHLMKNLPCSLLIVPTKT